MLQNGRLNLDVTWHRRTHSLLLSPSSSSLSRSFVHSQARLRQKQSNIFSLYIYVYSISTDKRTCTRSERSSSRSHTTADLYYILYNTRTLFPSMAIANYVCKYGSACLFLSISIGKTFPLIMFFRSMLLRDAYIRASHHLFIFHPLTRI